MAKKYFIRYGNSANMYDLAWAKDDTEMSDLEFIGFKRCSRKWAEQKAREEIDRQHYDPSFSGYADRGVKPALYYTNKVNYDYWKCNRDDWLFRYYDLKGVIWE